ncbi:MAG TPA: hypothetical protein VKD72_10685 [Gemmataceae bacterium]|nr:hypothetical protein [Gemmataceae bacterium]
MRKLMLLLLVVLLGIVAVGWFFEWYQVSVSGTSEGHQVVSIDINTPKIGNDLETAKQRVLQILQRAESPTPPDVKKDDSSRRDSAQP